MGVVVTMVMVVPLSMSMFPMAVPAAMPCRISTAFRLKRHVLFGHDQVHSTQHVGQHMVGLDLEVVGLQLDGHMAVAQVVGGAGQVKRRTVVFAVGDDQHGLGRCNHADHGTVFGHQHVAAAHQRATWQEDTQLAAGRVGGCKAAFLAYVLVEFNGGGTLEQHRGEALALGEKFGDLDHR